MAESDQNSPNPGCGAENATESLMRGAQSFMREPWRVAGCSCTWNPTTAPSPFCQVHGFSGLVDVIPLPSENLLRDRSHEIMQQANRMYHDHNSGLCVCRGEVAAPTVRAKGSPISEPRPIRALIAAALRAIAVRLDRCGRSAL